MFIDSFKCAFVCIYVCECIGWKERYVALITGAASSIGECIARHFCKHGAKVIIADIQHQLAHSVCQDIGPAVAHPVYCDVSNESHVENAVNVAVSKFGTLDIMINNAAIADPNKPNIVDNNVADFERGLSVNLTGVFLGTKHAARVMIPNKKGSIISVGSVSSSVGGVASHAYTSAKHGIIGLTKNVAAELGPYGIRVNCLSPYFIATPLALNFFKLENGGQSGVYSNLKKVALQQEDVAEAAIYLGSDESKYMSGHNLALDGGFTTINPAFGLFSRSKLD
ncbi:secoisolariciresinol dehydrogenase-like [Tripterygium wilfordii]|uniref:Secoisolariciresinol dehydrogenase-like n=1 Tax=Tripterygium wilfordii TaxID=458696 RepID=A0A7J7CV21_TRIWF|nr:secoisolariciresinol dehydrogenase-like [Tripterygium wilfordii]KAF5737913.1 secoisolariciresinol dehydrogenase-like [Tripterygium wilfordii]